MVDAIMEYTNISTTQNTTMINLAGRPKEECDAQCRKELTDAGIPIFPFPILQDGEVKTDVFGMFGAESCAKKRLVVWEFHRAWYYWVATLHLPSAVHFKMDQAMQLHAIHGNVVRVDGHCGAPSPLEWWGVDGIPCHYHIDTQDGLNAFARAVLQ